jgi:hypothetical protein
MTDLIPNFGQMIVYIVCRNTPPCANSNLNHPHVTPLFTVAIEFLATSPFSVLYPLIIAGDLGGWGNGRGWQHYH